MIIDTISNHILYPFGKAWEKAFVFLNQLSEDTPDGKYTIQKDDIKIKRTLINSSTL